MFLLFISRPVPGYLFWTNPLRYGPFFFLSLCLSCLGYLWNSWPLRSDLFCRFSLRVSYVPTYVPRRIEKWRNGLLYSSFKSFFSSVSMWCVISSVRYIVYDTSIFHIYRLSYFIPLKDDLTIRLRKYMSDN